MNRLYVVEGSPTLHRRLGRPPARAAQLRDRGLRPRGGRGPRRRGRGRRSTHAWVAPLAKDLKRAGARALVIAGESQPPAVHALAHAINEALGAVGTTVTYTAPAEAAPVGETAALAALVGEMEAGAVEVLVVLGSNPVYAAPADLDVRRGARQGAAPGPPRALPRRDGRALPLAPAGLAPARELGRPARRRRHGLDRPAADRAALQHALRASRSWPPSARASRRATRSSARTGRRSSAPADFEKRWNRALHDGVVAGTAFADEGGARSTPGEWAKRGRRRRRRPASRSPSAPTPPSSTGASPTSAGCRSCPGRSPSSPGTTWRS